jgi:adenosylhomocysteine nucleosidase
MRLIVALIVVPLVSACAGRASVGPANDVVAVLGVPEEIVPIERQLTNSATTRVGSTVVTSGTLAGRAVVVARSGVGKVNAAMAASLVIEHFHPVALIFSGTAGAVDPSLEPGDVVIGTRVAQHDIGRVTGEGFVRRPTRDSVSGQPNPMFFDAPEALLAAARRAAADLTLPAVQRGTGQAPPHVREGVIVTGDVFVADALKRDELRQFGATAVEMEGAAMVQVCRQFATPCLVIRGITDSANAAAQVKYQEYLKPASENAAEVTIATLGRISSAVRDDD